MSDPISRADLEALKTWAADLLLALAVERARVETLPEFNEWAREQGHLRNREHCLWKWVSDNRPALPDFPNPPAWCTSYDFSEARPQEVTIWLRGDRLERDGIHVRREQMVTVYPYEPDSIPDAEPPFIAIGSTDHTVDLPNLYVRHAHTLVKLLAEVGIHA